MRSLNPFRYRGYYYDIETGFYYLQSRYYNPEWGRFLNADGYLNANGDIIGYNMFAYCNNNPVNLIDENGCMAVAATIAVTNCWNPIGWIAAGVIVVGIVMLVAIVAIDDMDYCETDTIIVPASQAYRKIFDASNSDSSTASSTKNKKGPIGKAGRKKQGREANERKKIGDGKKWIHKGNKDPNRPMKKHTPARDHRRILTPYVNMDDEKNQYLIRWSR